MSAGLLGRLYRGETDADFVGKARRWFLLSGVLVLIGLVSLLTRGLNLGIDFEGGTSWELPAGDLTVESAREVLADQGVAEGDVQTLSDDEGQRVRVQAEGGEGVATQDVALALAEAAGVDRDAVDVQDVSPSWGDEITEKALRALIVFLVVVSIFITVRFEFKMALATLAALVHDLLVVIGVYSLFQFPVTPATVIAILTILGYSIYDGIVVFDRVDENAKQLAGNSRITYSGMVNASLNQVLMRTLNTSITALIPILSLLVVGSLILGAGTLQEFALALFVGQLSGAYSSIFIASPLLAILKEREPKLAAIKERLGGSTASGAGEQDALAGRVTGRRAAGERGTATTSAVSGRAATTTVARVRPTASDVAPEAEEQFPTEPVEPRRAPVVRPVGGGVTPRPRKKGKRR
ncbi:MAG: protein translocase subunit SecF [Actinomycetota bacterium]|nr:protein translocase subunit SecF [Actinomycetota bacterium]